jgi:hypothetical protein
VRSAAYALLVFGGAAVLGFVVAPLLGMASGLFPMDTEARAFFSLLTLKGVPYLVGLSAFSSLLHPLFSSHRLRIRVALFGLNVLLAWLIAASIALVILG